MSKRQVLMLIGAVLIIVQYLGLPQEWKIIANVTLGIIVILVSYTILPKEKKPKGPEHLPFSEHKSEHKDSTDGAGGFNSNLDQTQK